MEKGSKRPPFTEEWKRHLSESHKGKPSGNKGKKGLFKHSEEWKENLRKRMVGHKTFPNLPRGNNHYLFGKHHSKETRNKIGLAGIGRPSWNKGLTLKDDPRIIGPWKNKKRPNISGEKCYLWRGGITPEIRKIRNSLEYKIWRRSVFERDNYMCVWCKKRGGELNADHIKPFALYPELRFSIDNGRTLCKNCHRTIHKRGEL